jgi:hypothetical protein
MDWSGVTPAIFSLIGVALGTAGSLLGVYYAQRTARYQATLQHATALRDERRDVFLEYLRSVQSSWSLLVGLWGIAPLISTTGERLEGDAIDREAHLRNQELWYMQQKLAMVADQPVRDSALALTNRMYEATYHRERITEGLWQYLNPAQQEFLAAVREDLRSNPLEVEIQPHSTPPSGSGAR